MNYRLPKNVIPKNYKIELKPDLEKFIFKGKEKIKILIQQTNKVHIHSKDLKILSAKIIQNQKEHVAKIEFDEKTDQAIFTFESNLNGEAQLIIEFEGEINDKLVGLYRSRYLENGKEKYLLTTQFEAPYARRAFPCFDEPDFKASFELQVEIDKNLKAVSNMPIIEEIDKGQTKVVKFEKTPRMSTYLLYLGVGDFEFLGPLGKTRVITTPGKTEKGKFAMEHTEKILAYYEDYSEVPYPLPKVDLIAIPDFSAGAMENWGAITFREVLLLYGKETSRAIKKRILEVVAHELWHQWSGNLVTMKWWDDLWLNESFATYMAYKAMFKLYPEWKVWNDFILGEMASALNDDAIPNTDPIKVKVETPEEMEQAFSSITYSKGGSVLRMLDQYLGYETFRKGVSNYLKKFQYANADANEFWDAFSEVANQPVTEMMKGWIEQPGYPLIKVEKRDGKILLTQSRFCSEEREGKWTIPLVIKTESGEIRHLMKEKREILEIDGWFKLNSNQSGLYRVEYSSELLNEVLKHINSLNEKDIWGLENDLFNISYVQGKQLSQFLDLTEKLETTAYMVLSDLYANFSLILKSFENMNKNAFFSWSKRHFKKALEKVGWSPRADEPIEDTLLRSIAIQYLAKAGDLEVLNKSKELFEAKDIHPDLKRAVFVSVALEGGEKEWDFFKKLYITGQPEDRVNAVIALGNFKKLPRKSFEFFFSDEFRYQDIRTGIAVLTQNPEARGKMVAWLKEKFPQIKEMGPRAIMSTAETMLLISKNLDEFEQTDKFLDENGVGYKKTREQAKSRFEVKLKWIKNNEKIIEEKFAK